MTNPEQPVIDSIEQEPRVPELYDYKSVREAFYQNNVPEDDIAYVGGVVSDWGASLFSWSAIEEVRRSKRDLDLFSDRVDEAKKLLEKAEQLLIDEHWDQALEMQVQANEIIRARPGLFQFEDTQTGHRFVIEGLLLTGDHTHSAELYVTGEQSTVSASATKLRVHVDANKLDARERTALDQYVSQMEISPY